MMIESGPDRLPKVIAVVVESEICLTHECCVSVCPDVFDLSSGAVALKEGAERFYESMASKIFEAERRCPVDAIRVQTDPPRPTSAINSQSVADRRSRHGRSLEDRLREARGEQAAPKKKALSGVLNEALRRVLESLTFRRL
jgi:ferredoxin